MQLFLFNLNFNRFAPRIIRVFFAVLFICTNTYIIILFTLGSSESFWSFRWAAHLCTQKVLFKIRCCGPHNLIARYTTSLFLQKFLFQQFFYKFDILFLLHTPYVTLLLTFKLAHMSLALEIASPNPSEIS